MQIARRIVFKDQKTVKEGLAAVEFRPALNFHQRGKLILPGLDLLILEGAQPGSNLEVRS